MQPKIVRIALASLALVAVPAHPQFKFSTPLPSGIVSPAEVATPFGSLKLDGGVPDQASTDKIFDNLDFQRAVQGNLLVMVDAESFAGWSNFAALMAHLRFVRDHQKNIEKIAIVSDAKPLEFSAGIVKHFVQAELRHFACAQKNEAMQWLAGESS